MHLCHRFKAANMTVKPLSDGYHTMKPDSGSDFHTW